jgi:hypothetical protein
LISVRSEVQIFPGPPLFSREPGTEYRIRDSAWRRAETVRGLSSAGRAPALQAGCHRFDPDRLHHSFWRAVETARRLNAACDHIHKEKNTNTPAKGCLGHREEGIMPGWEPGPKHSCSRARRLGSGTHASTGRLWKPFNRSFSPGLSR